MHFYPGLHYISAYLAEINIQIPATEDGTPNWKVVQQVWEDMTTITDEFYVKEKYPSDLGLVSRLMGGSNLLLAPQYGNSWTLSIDIQATPFVPRELWEDFKVSTGCPV